MLEVAPWAWPVFDEYPNYRKANLRGGRGRGASEALARLVLKAMLQHEHNVLVAREHQTNLDQSNINLIKRVIRESPYAKYFDLDQKNTIGCKATGTTCSFKGIRLSLESWRSLSDFQLVWLEEPHDVTDEQLDIILPSLRDDDITLVASWNPLFEDSPVERLTGYDDALNLHATYADNPYFPEVLEEERQEAERTRPLDVYQWIWEGAYRQVGLMNPFGAAAINAAVEREWLPDRTNETVSGVDVAYTLDGDYTAAVTLDEAGNVHEAQHFRIEDPEARHVAIYEVVKDSYRVMVDTTEAAGTMAYAALRKFGINAVQCPFTRAKKHLWVTYAARRLQTGRATLHNCPELVQELKLFTADGLGKYEASVGYDDLACAWLLGFEALRQWELARAKPGLVRVT